MTEGAGSWIELEGAYNVRDLGGLPADGGRTRSGVLVRSDALDALTAADVDVLVRDVGIVHVVDLRAPTERAERAESRLASAGVVVSELAVIAEGDMVRRRDARAEAFDAGEDPAAIMAQGYVQLLDLGVAAFTAAFERIVAPGGAPALVHCSAGKDRTGVLVALMLDVARVDREAIIEDYAETQDRMAPVVERLRSAYAFHDLAQQVPAFVYEARPETMRFFLERLDDLWSGGAGYLQAHGVSEVALDRWRRLFVG